MKSLKLSDVFYLIHRANKLDSIGRYKEADNILIKIANYYPEQSYTKTKDISYFEWDDITDEQFKDNNKNYIEKKPNLIPKEYYQLPVGKDEENMEGKLNGEDSVPGPAYIDPGNIASSPSMAGGNLDYFKWDEVHDEDHPEYNRIPRR